jgi:hypothetical protein
MDEKIPSREKHNEKVPSEERVPSGEKHKKNKE